MDEILFSRLLYLLLELLDYVEANIDIEYPLSVDQQLKGNIDYVIRSTRDLIIIEAKNADTIKIT